MTEDAGSNRIDNYRECCPWLMLTRTFWYAAGLQVVFLAALGALGNSAGWRIAASLALEEDPVAPAASTDAGETAEADLANSATPRPLGYDVKYLGAWPGSRSAPACPFILPTAGEGTAELESNWQRLPAPPADPLVSVPYRIVRPLAQMLNRDLAPRHYAYYLLGGTWTLVLWSFFGAAITRIAALRFGRDEPIPMAAALAHGRAKLGAHLAACSIPVAVVLLGALLLILMGLVARLPFGATLVGLFWFLALLGSIVMAVVLIGLLFGWPLIWGAIDTECSDSFDGMSRAYAYAFQRPLKYLALVGLAALVGCAGWLLVWLASELVVQLAVVTVGAGAGSQPTAELLGESATESSWVAVGGFLVRFWNGVVRTLASAYGYGYFWCAVAGIYLLLRLDVDDTDLDDIPTDEAPGRFGLPPLDDSGTQANTVNP